MARKRMLDPSFFVDEDVAVLPPLARLFFQGLWGLADREGRLEDRPVRLKVQILPYDECDADAFLSAIADVGLIQRYQSDDGQNILQIRSFTKHQKPHPKEAKSTLPGPAVKSRGKTRLAAERAPESFPSVPKSESVSTELRLTPPAPTEPKRPRATPASWSGQACEAWAAVLGAPPGGKIGKALKPLVEEYGWDVVRPVWSDACALAAASEQNYQPAWFAERFKVELSRWQSKRREPEPTKRKEWPWERMEREDREADERAAALKPAPAAEQSH